jgi:hypothetical protein
MTDVSDMDCGSIAEPPGEVWILVDDMTGRAMGICPGPCMTVAGCHAVEYRPAVECRSVDLEEAIRKLDIAVAVCTEPAVLCLVNDALRVLGVNFGDTEQESKDQGDGDA